MCSVPTPIRSSSDSIRGDVLADEGWVIDELIDTGLIFPACDVPPPPPDAEVITAPGGIDIDFNKGDDRVVWWTEDNTTYVQAYGDDTLRSEPYQLPAGYRLAGGGDLDGWTPDGALGEPALQPGSAASAPE